MFVKVAINAVGVDVNEAQLEMHECARYRLKDDPKDDDYIQIAMEGPDCSLKLPKARTEIFIMSDSGQTIDRHTWYGHKAKEA